jgi:hypothetical protein
MAFAIFGSFVLSEQLVRQLTHDGSFNLGLFIICLFSVNISTVIFSMLLLGFAKLLENTERTNELLEKLLEGKSSLSKPNTTTNTLSQSNEREIEKEVNDELNRIINNSSNTLNI